MKINSKFEALNSKQIQNYNFQKKNGFTLIELLVVISIIGILAAMLTASYTEAQKNGRDAKRKGDLKSIQSALEQYRVTNSSYPGGTYPNGLSANNYFQNNVVPTDPRGGSGMNYHAVTYSTAAYSICADLEKIGSWSDTSPTDDICVSNLQ